MKVCMIASSYPRNERDHAGACVRSIATHLVELGHEAHVLAAYNPDVGHQNNSRVPLYHFRYAPTRGLHCLGYGDSLERDVRLKRSAFLLIPFYVVSGMLNLLALHRRERFDIFHAHWVLPGGLIGTVASIITGVPLGITLHGSDIYVASRNKLFGSVARLAFSRARFVTANSKDLRDTALRLGAKPESTHIVPTGVDPDVFDQSRVESASILSRFGLSPEDQIVVGIGRVVEKKGFDYLIRAVPSIVEKFPRARIVIGGAGETLPRLKALVEELGVQHYVKFPGAIAWQDVPRILAACDVFVMPSIRDEGGNADGMPAVILEAMASGKPVVGTNIAGIPIAVRDGYNGLLVEEKSAEGLAQSIAKLLASPELRKEMGEAGMQLARSDFDWARIAGTFASLYSSCVPEASSLQSGEV